MKTVAIVNHSAYGGGAEQGMIDIASCLDPEEYQVLAVLPERGDLSGPVPVSGPSVQSWAQGVWRISCMDNAVARG